MKRRTAILLLLQLPLAICSQVQQGNVRTIERPDAASAPLPGVTLRAAGGHSAVITDESGNFFLTLPGLNNGDAYSLQQVRKNGYELLDPGTVGRRYAYSSGAPLHIVMFSTAQFQADKQRIEENAYRVAEKNYKERLARLEAAKKSNEITIEEYRTEIEKLYTSFEKYQSLINSLSDHYARVDYSQLTELERDINISIENGELERADSLLKLIFDPLTVIEELGNRIAQAEEIISDANADLAAVLKQQEKDAEYLYHLYTIALSRFDNEKARFYIETRAALDTTNMRWQEEAADFFLEYLYDKEKAFIYAERELQIALATYGEQSYEAARAYLHIATVYQSPTNTNDLHKSTEYSKKSLEIMSSLGFLEVEDDEFAVKVYMFYAWEVYSQRFFDDAELLMKEAFNAYDSLEVQSPYLEANLWGYCGVIYNSNRKYAESYEANKKAVEIARECGYANKPAFVVFLSNYGRSCYSIGYYDEAIEALNEAIEISFEIFGVVHPYSLDAYSTLGSVYNRKHEDRKSYEYHLKALEHMQELYGDDNSSFGIVYSNLYNSCTDAGEAHLAGYYRQKAEEAFFKNYKQCYENKHYLNALRNYENAVNLLGDNSLLYFDDVLHEIGVIYEVNDNVYKAQRCYEKQIDGLTAAGKQLSFEFAYCCERLGYIKKEKELHHSAFEYFNDAFECYKRIAAPMSYIAEMAFEAGYQLYLSKKYDQALYYICFSLEIYSNLDDKECAEKISYIKTVKKKVEAEMINK